LNYKYFSQNPASKSNADSWLSYQLPNFTVHEILLKEARMIYIIHAYNIIGRKTGRWEHRWPGRGGQ